MGGTARVSVAVDAAWRVHVLVAELVSRGLVVSWHPTEEVRDDPPPVVAEEDDPPENPVKEQGSVSTPSLTIEAAPTTPPKPRFEVRTAYSRRLSGLARAWPDAAAQLFLSGPRLRLWVAAAGEPVAGGYALGSRRRPGGRHAGGRSMPRWSGRALPARCRMTGRHYVIAGGRRLKRLAELVGERPAAAPPEHVARRRRCVIFLDCVRHDRRFPVYGVAVGRMRWPDRYHPAAGCRGNGCSSGALR